MSSVSTAALALVMLNTFAIARTDTREIGREAKAMSNGTVSSQPAITALTLILLDTLAVTRANRSELSVLYSMTVKDT